MQIFVKQYIENLTSLSCWMNKFSVKIKRAQIFIVKHSLRENKHQYQFLIQFIFTNVWYKLEICLGPTYGKIILHVK